jgi:hypothetical protein
MIMAVAKIMAAAKFLVLAIIVAVLLPASREMLDDLVREFSGAKYQTAKYQTVLGTGASPTASIGSVDYDRKPSGR